MSETEAGTETFPSIFLEAVVQPVASAGTSGCPGDVAIVKRNGPETIEALLSKLQQGFVSLGIEKIRRTFLTGPILRGHVLPVRLHPAY